MALTQINPALFAGSSNTTAVIQSNGTTAITVDSSQNVGVGVTSPAAKLDVSTSTSYGGIKINGANGASVNLYQPQSNASARNYQLVTNYEAWGTLDFQRSADNATAPSVTLMSLNNAGTVVLKGGAISNSGVGIAFPATQVASSNANTLDDYEEGTWTFGVSFGGGTTGITYSETAGSYTRVGNMVNIRGYCELTSKGSSSGAAQVTGLPFVCSSATNAHTSCGIALNNVSFNAWPMCWIGPTTALGNIYQSTTGGALSAIQNTNFNNTSWIMISCSYYTTA